MKVRATLAILAALAVGAASAQERPRADAMDTVALQFHYLSIKDGLSQGMVHWIMQDRSGFMWFATKDGLNRYDGYTFKIYRHDPADPASLRNSFVTAVKEDSKRRLWIGTSAGLDLFDREAGTFIHFPCGGSAMGGKAQQRSERIQGCGINSVDEDPFGHIWVSTDQGISRLELPAGPLDPSKATITTVLSINEMVRAEMDSRGVYYGHVKDAFAFVIDTRTATLKVDTIELDRPDRLLVDNLPVWRTNMVIVDDTLHHRLYGVHPFGVVEIDTITHKATTLMDFNGSRTALSPYRVAVDANGVLWVPNEEDGALWFDPTTRTLTSVVSDAEQLQHLLTRVKCTFRDRNGLIWVGTSGYGLLTYDPRHERFHKTAGNSVQYMMPVLNGEVAVNEVNFLTLYDPVRHVRTLALSEHEVVRRTNWTQGFWWSTAIQPDPKGGFWFNKGGLVYYDPSTDAIARFLPMDGAGRPLGLEVPCFPLKLLGDTIWFGASGALQWFDTRSHRFGRFDFPIPAVDNPYVFLQAIHRDAQGIFWLGTVKGLLRFDPRALQWRHFHNDPKNEFTLSDDVLFSIEPDPQEPDHYLWIGTNGGGLNRFDMRTDTVKRFTTKDGLPNDVVYGVLSDARGDLWMSTNKGIARFTPSTATFRNYDAGAGLQNDEFNRNAYCRTADGYLLFGGVSGFNCFRPEELQDDRTAAIVLITDIKIKNRSIIPAPEGSPLRAPSYLSRSMEIPYSENMITFEFATMEFSAPGSHQYQYKLEGFDPEWIMAGTNHSAVYTNLDPGEYTFRVRGSNRDKIWDEVGTSFGLSVLPPWYRTWWFYSLCSLLFGGGILLYVFNLRWQRDRLEKTVRARTVDLARERDRSDELLRNILPEEVAEELKAMGHTEAKHFHQVTVLFSDFEGFTRISEQLSPAELVEELNVCFKAFDRIMEKYGIEKIKTIGDAYMAAGGVPDPATGPPAAVVRAGLEMQHIMAERKVERDALGRPAFSMRLGIHTGPVVAGIVGLKKFAYDMWGDTVNIASRMESMGEVGRVNISQAAFACVKDEPDLLFTPRGMVQVKGKGEMEMFLVDAHETVSAPEVEQFLRPVIAQALPRTDHSTPIPLQDLRILLVEDNNFNAMVAQDELMDLIPSAVVHLAKDGKFAMEMVQAGTYDVILMDVQMPVMDGYEATRAIRKLPGEKARTPIIAMTANTMQAEVDRCMEAGMVGFVPKPFRREQLLVALQEALRR